MILLCHGRTEAVRRAACSADEPLDEQGRRGAARLTGSIPDAEDVVTAPSLCCRQTAELAGLSPRVDLSLAAPDYGSWTGRTVDDVEQSALTAWLADPTSAPHGGESLADVLARIGAWLDGLPPRRSVLAIADAAVIRSALVHAVAGRPESVWRFDVTPLSMAVLVGEPGRWNLRTLGLNDPVSRN